MFGTAIERFVESLNFIQILVGSYAILGGIWAGYLWRTSHARERHLVRLAAKHPKLCHECRWALPEMARFKDDQTLAWRYAHCMHPTARINPEHFLVTGIDHPEDMASCATARRARYGECGPLGKFWEPGAQLIAPPPRSALAVGNER